MKKACFFKPSLYLYLSLLLLLLFYTNSPFTSTAARSLPPPPPDPFDSQPPENSFPLTPINNKIDFNNNNNHGSSPPWVIIGLALRTGGCRSSCPTGGATSAILPLH
ncbi:hypothetical protein L195_g025946 [Trifolium pratense]|uniref:Uncharacterized protein n=1 Tax=Trifolium pratense TaxID=57577 RepID=A0A2K3NHY5_TRIPR|nr:hypothetical protein L195_g025946 [Trifolium pratense]